MFAGGRSACAAQAALAGLALLAACTVAGCTGGTGSAPSMSSVRSLLKTHGAAVRNHDAHAFAAGLSTASSAAGFRTQQLAEFHNVTEVPLASWSYVVAGRTDDHGFERTATKRYGATAIIVRLSLRYALRGVDTAPAAHDLWWTFIEQNGHTVVAGDDALVHAGGVSWQGPWDFGRIDVVSDAAGLVIGHPEDAALLHTVARLVVASVPAVSAVWGTQWSRRVAVLVPSTSAELSADVGDADAQAGPVAALAVSDGTDPLSHAVLEQRLVVYPSALRELSTVGAQIVFRHEITHIASARSTGETTPRWLVEGFADYVGNLHSGQPVAQAASELRTAVRAGKVPTALPTDDDFDTAGAQAQAYEGAWLACRLIAAQVGQAGLVRFYRLVGAQPTDTDTAVATVVRSVLHESTPAFVAQWRSYLHAQLGH